MIDSTSSCFSAAPASSAPRIGSLVEADVIGCAGTFRVIEGHRAPEAGKLWIRETGLHLVAGAEPFVIEWPIADLRVVEV